MGVKTISWSFFALIIFISTFILSCIVAEFGIFELNNLYTPLKKYLYFNEMEETIIMDYNEDNREEHVVIFDAGSTGTRIHVFTFQIETEQPNLIHKNKRKRIILKSEYFKSITPGLSSFAEQPEEAAKSIETLLKFGDTVIEKKNRVNTSLSLIATAGLRLLPDSQSAAILDNIENLLLKMEYPYKMNEDSIKILDGNSEGIFSWVTINFLLKKIHNAKKSVAVLDLGGGSTQITFSPNLEETLFTSPSQFLIKKKILGEEEHLYTHSYLGFGLMATRKSILMEAMSKKKQYFSHENVNVSHPCFESGITTKWVYQYVTYTITGIEGDCYQFVNNYLKRTNELKKAIELNEREIYAISYYFDRMVDVGVIGQDESIGDVYVRDFYLAAKQICGGYFDTDKNSTFKRFRGQKRFERDSKFIIKRYSEFLCLDLTYIANLLNTGFGINWKKKITLGKRINKVELSWALGAAFSLLNYA